MTVALIAISVYFMNSKDFPIPGVASASSMDIIQEVRTLTVSSSPLPPIILLESGAEIAYRNTRVAVMERDGNLAIYSLNGNPMYGMPKVPGWDLVSSVTDDGYHTKFNAVPGSRLELRLESAIIAVVDSLGIVVWSDAIVEVDSSYDTFELSLSSTRALQVLASKSSDPSDKVVIYDFFSACAVGIKGC